jgi:putative ABC transport system permease protein
MDAALFRPLPYGEDKNLVMLWTPPKIEGVEKKHAVVSYPDFLDWQKRSTSFTAMAAYNITAADLTNIDIPENVAGAAVSSNFFSVLGVSPQLGNGFENTGQDPNRIVLSAGLWQRHFGGSKSVLGEKIFLSGRPYTIVGVLPASFEQPEPFWDRQAEFWIPLPPSFNQFSRRDRLLRVTARLKPGVSISLAQAEMVSIAEQMEKEFPQTNRGLTVQLISLREQMFGEYYRPLLLMFAGALAVLLIACANVTNLQLARMISRSQEMLVRSALGAGRLRLTLWAYGEALLLALAGAAGGMLLAFLIVQALLATGKNNLAILSHANMNVRVLLFIFGLVLIVALLTAIIPTFRMLAHKPGTVLNLNSRSYQSGNAWRQLRALLVSAQLSLVLPLLIVSLLLSRSFLKLAHVDPGFKPEQALTFRLSLAASRYPDPNQVRSFFSNLSHTLQAVPGVQSVGIVSGLPLTVLNTQQSRGFTLDVDNAPGNSRNAYYRVADQNYLQAMNIRLLSGRNFNEADGLQGQYVAMVNETFVRDYWPGQNPLGKRIRIDGMSANDGWVTVVGTVGDVHYNGLAEVPSAEFYVPFNQDSWRSMAVVVRTNVAPSSILANVKAAVAKQDPLLPLSYVQNLQEIISNATSKIRLSVLVITISAGLAFLLALVGVSGVVAYLVTERRHEFGIRLALGAQVRDILMLVLSYGLKLAVLGCLVGITVGISISHLFSHLIYGIKVLDFISFFVASLLLLCAVLAACYIPARKAVAIQPASSLRVD